MKRRYGWIVLLALCVPGSLACATEFDLYFLGGQSNMEGFGTVEELPAELQGTLDGAFIFQSTPMADQTKASGDGNWSVFRPGHGTGFVVVDGRNVYSNRFGLEVSLAHALKAAAPNRKIAIIKYARNGSSIAIGAAGPWGCWDPDFQATEGEHRENNQYDHFLITMRQALADRDIDGDGADDRLIPKGIAWMQGESDAANPWHYDSQGYIDLGRQFAEAFGSLTD